MKRQSQPWELVAFITVETGDDLIVSFAVCEADDPKVISRFPTETGKTFK
jgi:hypothetical protein